MDRRLFLRRSATALTALAGGAALGCTPLDPGPGFELQPPDTNGLMLPPGFQSRVLARSLNFVGNTGHVWHLEPDGGAVFPTPNGWIYVSNSESLPGGVGALEFNGAGAVIAARPILQEFTLSNCAGGATPWGTWLSCEEWEWGRVWECDPTGRRAPQQRLAMGQFNHEAVAVDPVRKVLYLTEDCPDGCLYRFVPDRWEDLSTGLLSAATVDVNSQVTWTRVPNPNPTLFDVSCRKQVAGATTFRGGEGIVYDRDHVYFTTKGDNKVWDLDAAAQRLSIRYDAATSNRPELRCVDNITAGTDGSLYVAEDGGNMELVLVDPFGGATPVLRVIGQDRSEITGPAFDPTGQRIYFSSQRGTDGLGITYEVVGPFAAFARAAVSR